MSFTVYRSSAGSGKTFTLVKEYLKIILLEPQGFRNILAITFTNKAAAEMKERALHSLQKLSEGPRCDDPGILENLLPQLVAQTALTEPEIAERASKALKLILHHYSDFAIGTIDSFSHRIIRSFAFDFGLPMQFNVELNDTELLTTAVDLLLDRVGDDEELTRFLVKFLEVRMDEDKGWNIERILVDFAHVLLEEEGQEHIVALRILTLEDFDRITNFLYERITGFEKLVRKIGQEAISLIEDAGLTSDNFYQGKKGIAGYFAYLSAGRFDKLQPNSFVLKTIADDKWESGRVTAWEKDSIEAIKDQLRKFFDEIEGLLEQGQENYALNKLVVKTIFPLAVLNEIDRVLTEFKKQNNLVHISEFNRRISSVVMNEPVPFIYERLGEKYRHLMIDEFQDTSKLQWQNFVPLLENSLSSGYFNLVVGDGKQAIYRWRNGDVAQFTRLPALHGSDHNPLIHQREQVLKSHFVEESLNRNYRSKREIVELNNRLFRFLSDSLGEPEKSVYQNLEQAVDPGNSGGLITFQFLNDGQEDLSFEEMNFKTIREIIHEATADGYSLNEIAILCRKNDQASRIACMLTSEGTAVVSSESLLLNQSLKVNFLISLIRFLYAAENKITQAEIVMFLIRTGKLPGMNLQEILHRITSKVHSGNELLRLMKDHGMDLRREELLALPVYDLIETLIRIFSLNHAPDSYLQFFLDATLQFMTRDRQGAVDFLDWWEEQQSKLSVVVPEGLDALRIMTIHKAKGLQFPVVIFPYATEAKRLTRDHLWVDLNDQHIPGLKTALLKTGKEMENTIFRNLYAEEGQKSMLDLINLLYVVMTRPENRMYVLTSFPHSKTEEMKSLPDFFAGFLESEGRWDPSKSKYEFGSKTIHEKKAAVSPVDVLTLNTFISTGWRNKIRVRKRAPEMWDLDNPMGRARFGNQVHTLLASICNSLDLEPVLNHAKASGLLSRDDEGPVSKMLGDVINHPLLSAFYSGSVAVKTEPEILLPDGHVFRPDRVVFDQGITAIIEYKTGKKEEQHLRQLDQYEKLLMEMGYNNIRKYLVYLHENIEVIQS